MHAVTFSSLLLLTDRSTQPATCLIDNSAQPLIGGVGKIVQLAAQSQEYPRLSIHGSISRKQRKSPIALSTTNPKGESERRPRLGARASGPHAFHPAGNVPWASIPQDQRLLHHQGTGLPTHGRRAGRRPAHPGSLASPVGTAPTRILMMTHHNRLRVGHRSSRTHGSTYSGNGKKWELANLRICGGWLEQFGPKGEGRPDGPLASHCLAVCSVSSSVSTRSI